MGQMRRAGRRLRLEGCGASRLAQARAFLMDRETLPAHEAHWGVEPEPERHDLPRRDQAQRQPYDGLRANAVTIGSVPF